MQCSVWLLALASGLGQRGFLQLAAQTESFATSVGKCRAADGTFGGYCDCGAGVADAATCFAKVASPFVAASFNDALGKCMVWSQGDGAVPTCPEGCTDPKAGNAEAVSYSGGDGTVGVSCLGVFPTVVATPAPTPDAAVNALLWPRLVSDVQRTELKVNRLRARMAKLNARIDAVLNRTGNTQPIVLSFKDRAIVTGTLAAQNNFTIRALKPRMDASGPLFRASEGTIAADWAGVARDHTMLGDTPELDSMQRNLTIFGVELENVVPAIEKFDGVTSPMESFLKETHPVIIRRAVDRAMTDFLGDTLGAMASHLEAAPAP